LDFFAATSSSSIGAGDNGGVIGMSSSSLDLLPLPIQERVNMEASKRADFVRKIHVKTKEAIEKKGKYTADHAKKKRKEVLFQPGDMVWVQFCKDRFPQLRKFKLLPRGTGPYKVLAKINDNAYKIDLPTAEYGISNSFSIADLTPYEDKDLAVSRSTPFEGGGRRMRTYLLHHHYLLLLSMKMLLRRSPMRLGLDQLQEHVQSYWNNR
jgi:hypothetical protein